MIKRCWQYTWRGPVNERTNTTGQGCSNEANQKHVPCFEPIVWTNGTNKHNQPNLDDLKEKCENGDTLDNKVSRHLFELQKKFQTVYFFYFAKHMKTIGYVMHFHKTAIAAVCMFCSHFFCDKLQKIVLLWQYSVAIFVLLVCIVFWNHV